MIGKVSGEGLSDGECGDGDGEDERRAGGLYRQRGSIGGHQMHH